MSPSEPGDLFTDNFKLTASNSSILKSDSQIPLNTSSMVGMKFMTLSKKLLESVQEYADV